MRALPSSSRMRSSSSLSCRGCISSRCRLQPLRLRSAASSRQPAAAEARQQQPQTPQQQQQEQQQAADQPHPQPREPLRTVDLADDLGHETSWLDWKWGSRIKFVRAGRSGPPLLLCHGFGVGAYHFERNVTVLARDHRVYAVDLLGQGSSWPTKPDCEQSGPLQLSADTWIEQLHHFITDRIGEPCYIAGNSLGGYLAVNLAARHPDAVKGLILLNAAPFWAQRPPAGQEGLLWRLLPMDATLPVNPAIKGLIERSWWANISNPGTIRSLLQLVYARPAAIDEALLERIVEATRRPDAIDAFASIVLAPRPRLSFDECLARLSCPVCLAYGREDPWVVPRWGARAKATLPSAQYLELSPAGHCAHHEAPAAVNAIIQRWVAAVEAGTHTQLAMLQPGTVTSFEEADGQLVKVTCLDAQPQPAYEQQRASAAWRLQRAVNEALQRLGLSAPASPASSLADGGEQAGQPQALQSQSQSQSQQ